jgi:acetyltransferase-like isoleucine patch superfamily enzyme
VKAYLLANPAPLPPFGKPAAQLRFKDGTLRERLIGQLRAARLEIVPVAALAEVAPRSIIVTDDVVASDTMIGRFLAAIPDPSRSYHLELDTARFTLLASQQAAPQWRAIPLRYRGDTDAPSEPLRLQPVPVFEVLEGLPARMHLLTDIRIYFFDIWAVPIAYWFELETATSLYCREYVARLIGGLRRWVPRPILDRCTRSPWLMGKFNVIGKGCRIHRTAILEGCVIGDGVEIGPFAYLRSSVIGAGAVVREKSSIKMSYVGERAFIMGSDLVNCYVGAETSIFTPMLYNAVFGERGFLSGGSGFADFILGAASIPATIDGKQVASGLPFLASAVGDDCFIGANLLFAPGRTIPDGTRLLDHGLIKAVPTQPGGSFVVSGTDLLQIPDAFLAKRSA